jgi:hypothetical protein
MHNCLFYLFSFPCLLSLESYAQIRMETDRPDQTETPFLIPKKYIQGEIGFNYEKYDGLKTLVYPTALWKYGLSNKFELRVITELTTIETAAPLFPSTKKLSGLLPVQFGGKLAICMEKGIIPITSLIFHVAPPTLGSKNLHTNKWAPNFRFVMQNTLSETAAIGYNLGAEWNGEDNNPFWIYTIAPGFNIGKKWYGYIELFGAVSKTELPQHAADAGIAYYFTDDLKIDFSGGFGITEAAIDNYVALGFSFRVNTMRKKVSNASWKTAPLQRNVSPGWAHKHRMGRS